MTARPAYYPGLQELARQLELRPGAVTHVAVRHDDWCAYWRHGICNCSPDVEVLPGPPIRRGAA